MVSKLPALGFWVHQSRGPNQSPCRGTREVGIPGGARRDGMGTEVGGVDRMLGIVLVAQGTNSAVTSMAMSLHWA